MTAQKPRLKVGRENGDRSTRVVRVGNVEIGGGRPCIIAGPCAVESESQGLTIAAWVSLWEALAIFLVEWFPHRKNIALYRRLARARLVFRSRTEKVQE